MRLRQACVTVALGASAAALLLPRQQDGAVEKKNFMRRGFHQSAVLDGWLYIDGGHFSYLSSPTGIIFDYSNTLLAIDLSKDFYEGDANITAIAKPAGVPNLLHGGLWADEKDKLLYVGFAGVQSEFFGDQAPQPYGLWSFAPSASGGGPGKWTHLNDTAPAFKTQPRPFFGQGTSGGGKGYYLGGKVGPNRSTALTPNQGLMVYDFSTRIVTNETSINDPSKGSRDTGGLHFIPNFGSKGILVALGGHAPTGRLFPLSLVEVLDVAGGNWYAQQTSGGPPSERREFCVTGAASAQGTYEIFLYAGWDGRFGPAAIPKDEAWILTLPGFRWVKADYPPLHPRQGHTCEHAGGGQIIVIGGIDTMQQNSEKPYQATFETQDRNPNGLGVFDTETMQFVPKYTAQRKLYNSHWAVRDYYSKNPNPAFANATLAEVFKIKNFESPPSTTSSNSTTSGNSNSEKANNTAAIAGGVVGGLAGLCLIALGCWLYIRKWKKQQARRAGLGGMVNELGSEKPSQKWPAEAHGDYGAQEMNAEPVMYEMWAGPTSTPVSLAAAGEMSTGATAQNHPS